MSIKEESFTIGDHEYTTICHTTTSATRLVMDIYATLAGPGLGLLKSLAEARGEMSMDSDISEVFDHVDEETLSTQVQAALRQLDEGHLRELFRKSTRDGEDLSVDTIYDEAYAGNWSEWLQAIYEIVRVNGFVDFLFTITER